MRGIEALTDIAAKQNIKIGTAHVRFQQLAIGGLPNAVDDRGETSEGGHDFSIAQ